MRSHIMSEDITSLTAATVDEQLAADQGKASDQSAQNLTTK